MVRLDETGVGVGFREGGGLKRGGCVLTPFEKSNGTGLGIGVAQRCFRKGVRGRRKNESGMDFGRDWRGVKEVVLEEG